MSDQQANASNPYQPPKAAVSDVTAGTHALAGRGTRLVAVILDGLIFSMMVYAPLVIAGVFTAIAASIIRKQPLLWTSALVVSTGVALIMCVVYFVITFVFVKRNGQTIAKKILGIKVVRKNGSKAGVGRIFWLRNVVNTLFAMVPLVGGIYALVDALMIFGDPRQCIHDKIADTIVIRA